ncbi:MAG TPA: non-canonical purine NTP pyrophosphatase, partial [Bacteroidia bacterium]|nr:non-canonical purine NTP pyrophosphatase [Bacteroidia bacterium]
MDLIFATQNRNKFQEIAALIPPGFNLSPLSPGLFPEELDEPFDKLELNALHKARTVSRRTGKTTF